MMKDTVLAESKQLVSDILSGSDYFTCERTHTRMKKEICVKRQTSGLRNFGGSWKYARQIPSECMDCEQGKQTKEELEVMDIKPKTCTKPGCEEPVKAKGLCTKHYNNEYNKQLREKDKGLREKVEIEPGKPVPEKAPTIKEGHAIIMVDFADFPELLEQLEQRARTDIRSIENEVLYLLKCGLEESI